MTTVDIANQALTACGAEGVLVKIDDQCKEGRLCSFNYDKARRAVLAKHPWKFALKRALLDYAADQTPAFGYSYAYPVPENYLRAVTVNDRFTEWTREGRYILCNDGGQIQLRYIGDEEAVELFDPLFADAVALDLASRIVYSLSQSNERTEAIRRDYETVIRRARFADSFDQSMRAMQADTYVLARQTSDLWTPPGGG